MKVLRVFPMMNLINIWVKNNMYVCGFCSNECLFCLDQFMGDVDQDEIDLDEDENDKKDDVKDIARFVYLIRVRIN